jgi:hypothetical protein
MKDIDSSIIWICGSIFGSVDSAAAEVPLIYAGTGSQSKSACGKYKTIFNYAVVFYVTTVCRLGAGLSSHIQGDAL